MDKGGLWEKAKKAWGAVGSAFDLQQLLALFGLWKLVGAVMGGIGGGGVALFSQFPVWGVILAAAVGVGLGLLIVNEVTSRRAQTRVQRQSAEVPTDANDDVKQLAQPNRIREIEAHLKELQPSIEWARGLIERERGHPSMYLNYKALFWGLNLVDREPYFEIGIFLNYVGIFDLIIGERQSGRLSWQNKPFSHEPVLTMGSETSRPFKLHGPTEGQLRLRQYVTPKSGAEIQAFLDRGVEEIEFWARDFEVSLSKASFDGEILAEGRMFGEYLAVGGTKRYKIPVDVTPSFDEPTPNKGDSPPR